MILSLLGCAVFEDLFDIDTVSLEDHIDGLTDPFVIQAWYLGVAPLDPVLEIDDTSWSKGAIGLAFIGNASDLGDLEETPLAGAEVTFHSPDMGSVPLREIDAGTYKGSGEEGLEYHIDQPVTLRANDGETMHSVLMPAPKAPTTSIPVEHTRGQPMVIDIEGQGYDGLLVMVVDVETQQVLFDNTPADGYEILEFLNGDRPQRLEVPGAVFDRNSLFAVGVCGLKSPNAEDYVEFNTALSRVITGQIEFSATTTIDLP